MKNLPGWATYLISGLAAVLVLVLTISGTMIARDRDNLEKTMCGIKSAIERHHEELKSVIERQDKQIHLLTKHNATQNHVMDKICMFLSVPYEKRREMMKEYPILIKPPIETP